MTHYFCIIIGGGITGVTCAEELASLEPDKRILVISASPLVKSVSGVVKVGRAMESFTVAERPASDVFGCHRNVTCCFDVVDRVEYSAKKVLTKSGINYSYDYLCLCTGGKPKVISSHPRVVGIRDTQSVDQFQKLLKVARRIVVVGNGGIATELVYDLRNVDIVWAIKHASISATFVDAGAAEFFLPHIEHKRANANMEECLDFKVSKRVKYGHATSPNVSRQVQPSGEGCTALPGGNDEGGIVNGANGVGDDVGTTKCAGSALGPDWTCEMSRNLLKEVSEAESHTISIEYECEVDAVYSATDVPADVADRVADRSVDGDNSWPVFVKLTNGSVYGCDFVVSATGVVPNTDLWRDANGTVMELAEDGGIPVSESFRTTQPDVYAAGDACTAQWDWAPHWHQMRLWTQAKQMGAFTARCISARQQGTTMSLDICFEIFTHVTNFFGFKVILLGQFNAQGLQPDECEILLRVQKGEEFVKVVLHEGRVVGVILIGETDLEETFENLILNQTSVEHLKDDLLNPTVDIEDYFD